MKFTDIQHKPLGIYGMGVEGKSLSAWFTKHKARKIFCFDENFSGNDKYKTLTKEQKEIFEVTFGERKKTILKDKEGKKIMYVKGNRRYGAQKIIRRHVGETKMGKVFVKDFLLIPKILEKGAINVEWSGSNKYGNTIIYEYIDKNVLYSLIIEHNKEENYSLVVNFFTTRDFIFQDTKKIEGVDLQDQQSPSGYLRQGVPNTQPVVPQPSTSLSVHKYYVKNQEIFSLPLSCLSLMHKIFRSPGVHPQKILKYIGEENKKKISSSTQLFFDLCPTKNIIGITGTKGKGTTSSLVYEMLNQEKQRRKVFLGGNIGTSVFDFFDEIKKDDVVILELSSFQLYDLKKSPHIAVLLRTDTEHLDWHSAVGDYRDAKKNIFLHQKKDDVFVYIGESEIIKEMISIGKVGVPLVGTLEEKMPLPNKKISYSSRFTKDQQKIFSAVGLRGDFHQENILAAIEVAKQMGVSQKNMKEVIKKFSGLPMRCELVGEKNDRKFFNDSFSTIPQTTISALSTFTTPVFLILGGSEKESDFTELYLYIKNYKFLKKIYLVGEAGNRIWEEIQNNNNENNVGVPLVGTLEKQGNHKGLPLPIQKNKNFKEIFDDFKNFSQAGDSLLLSPACASFGMFENYKKRGEAFNRLVQNYNQ